MNYFEKFSKSKPPLIPQLVLRNWWIGCVPAILGVGVWLFVRTFFDVISPIARGWVSFPILGGFCLSSFYFAMKFRSLHSKVGELHGCLCTNCGYSLKMAADTGACPECGKQYRLAETVLEWNTWMKESVYRRTPRFPRKKTVLVVAALCGLFFILTIPAFLEEDRAEKVCSAAVDMGREETTRILGLESLATAEGRAAVTVHAEVVKVMEEAIKKSLEASSSRASALKWSLALVFTLAGCALLWSKWQLILQLFGRNNEPSSANASDNNPSKIISTRAQDTSQTNTEPPA